MRGFWCALMRMCAWNRLLLMLMINKLSFDLLFQRFKLLLLCTVSGPTQFLWILLLLIVWDTASRHSISIVACLDWSDWLLDFLKLITASYMNIILLWVALKSTLLLMMIEVKGLLTGNGSNVVVVCWLRPYSSCSARNALLEMPLDLIVVFSLSQSFVVWAS